jgi:hypothetical protein
VFLPVSKADVVADRALTENLIWWIVREYAGTPNWGRSRMTQGPAPRYPANPPAPSKGIQLLLGHGSIQTTMDYPGTRQNRQKPSTTDWA